MSKPGAHRTVAKNRKARFDYKILETVEAGIELVGSEVKSMRAGKATIADAYVNFDGGEAWLLNLHIAEYPQANRFNHEPTRKRRLLLKRKEIDRLNGKIRESGLALIPLEIYFSGSWVKVLLGLGKGKKHQDKRHSIKERETKREMERHR